MTRRLILLLAACAFACSPADRALALTPGGGSATSDCLAEFGGTAANYPVSRPREIRCVDNTACDENPEQGVCEFHTNVCLNVSDPNLPSCTPQALETFFIENPQPDTNPKHDFDFQTLEDQMNFLVLPLDATDTNVCSSDVQMTLRLPIQPSRKGGRYRRRRKSIESTVSGAVGVRDDDRFTMSCVAIKGATPCDGVTSTFEQIQRQIFTPTCATSTCHNVAQGEHQMSLADGEAYASLVGIAPANAVASAAGLLRVDPGNPGNSFILKKLRGELVDGEGEPMPRDLKPLHHLNVDLIQEWIAAGAPATGFVATFGCH